jgi:hypothetical protein
MAFGSTKKAVTDLVHASEITRPCQIASFWQVINSDLESQDNSGTPDPYGDSPSSTPHFISIPTGTTLRLGVRYTAGESMSTDPVLQVFGRTVAPLGTQDNTETTNQGSVGIWQRLLSKAGDIDSTFVDASTDISDGTYEYTASDLDAHSYDLDGCNQVIVLVKTAAAGVTGDVHCIGKVI